MGQDLVYRSADAVCERRISRADWELIQALRQHRPREVDLLFSVPELGDEIIVRTSELRSAVEEVESFLAARADLLPYTYQFKCERSPVPGVAPGGFGTGGMSGLRLPGDAEHFYFIEAGLNECVLEKCSTDADGRGVMIERRDLRGERQLQTESHGTISLRRTRAKSELRRILREIAGFLAAAGGDDVIKTVT